MQSSTRELLLPLGESLASEIATRAEKAKCSPAQWLAFFLAKGRLTPAESAALIDANKDGYFFNSKALNA